MYRLCFPAIAMPLPAIALSLAISSVDAKPSETSADYTAKPYSDSGNPWFTAGEKALKDKADAFQTIRPEKGAAKNVILFVGDGMGISTITAARILDGQNKGMSGEENTLSFGRLPFSGLSKTYNVDQQTPDSAGTMSAMMTGVRSGKITRTEISKEMSWPFALAEFGRSLRSRAFCLRDLQMRKRAHMWGRMSAADWPFTAILSIAEKKAFWS